MVFIQVSTAAFITLAGGWCLRKKFHQTKLCYFVELALISVALELFDPILNIKVKKENELR